MIVLKAPCMGQALTPEEDDALKESKFVYLAASDSRFNDPAATLGSESTS